MRQPLKRRYFFAVESEDGGECISKPLDVVERDREVRRLLALGYKVRSFEAEEVARTQLKMKREKMKKAKALRTQEKARTLF